MSNASALTTWQELPAGRVLVAINSKDEAAVSALFDRLSARIARDEVFVVAQPQWLPLLEARGIPAGFVLPVVDAEGRTLDLNYFMENPPAGIWIRSKAVDFIVGTDAHSLYNEEVKDVFEERLTLFVGPSRFLAHTLPDEYVYVFDLSMLRHRLGRSHVIQEYLSTCRAMVDEWHGQWLAAGRPQAADEPDRGAAVAVLTKYLGPDILAFDEASTIPIKRPESFQSDEEAFRYLQDLVARTQSLQQEVDSRQREIDRRDRIIVEEVSFRQSEVNRLLGEVDRRDGLIAEAHADLGRAIVRYDATLEGYWHRLMRKLGWER